MACGAASCNAIQCAAYLDIDHVKKLFDGIDGIEALARDSIALIIVASRNSFRGDGIFNYNSEGIENAIITNI